MIFVHGIHKQKEYCLSVVQNLTSKYQSRIDDGTQIDCTSDMTNAQKRSCSETTTLSCREGSMTLRPE